MDGLRSEVTAVRHRVVAIRDLVIHRSETHTHVTSVVTGPEPWQDERNWTVAEVLAAMAQGDSFYTKGESTEKTVDIERYTCGRCGGEWLRSCGNTSDEGDIEIRLPYPTLLPS